MYKLLMASAALVLIAGSAQAQSTSEQFRPQFIGGAPTLNVNDTQYHNATGIGYGGTSAANNTGNNQTTSFVDQKQTASAYAPPVVNVASCAIGGSVGGQGPAFGFSIGGAKIDKQCNARANAQVLMQLGRVDAALRLLAASSPELKLAIGD